MSDEETFVINFFDHVEKNKDKYIDELGKAVAIPSISSELDEHLKDIVEMINYTKKEIERLGGKATLVENPAGANGTEEKSLPPILLGEFHVDPKKKTVCVYGHLDVQPAKKEDGWDTDPFVLTEKDGKLYGRGSTDDKGPALSWLWVIEAYQTLGVELPVNIKILYEGMEEYGSEGLFETIVAESKENKFLYDVDFFCISDNYWLGKTKPCLTYGLRGICYFELTVQGCEQDLHSGVLGGTVHESMTDLIQLMSTLVNSSDGKILIDGIMDDVKPVTSEEEALYDDIEFDCEEFKEENKIINASSNNKLLHEDAKSLLMHRWRFPSLSLHGIEGAFSGSGAKTVIPAKVIGKFSMRLVPDQDPNKINEHVKNHLDKEFKKLNSPNKMSLKMTHGAKSWLSSPKHPNYAAAAAAIKRTFGSEPNLTREGGSIPITTAIEDATGMNVLLLPIGACDDMAHSQNEKYNISNLINGVKVLGLYIRELGKIMGPKPSECRCKPLTEEELMVPGAFIRGFKCSCEI